MFCETTESVAPDRHVSPLFAELCCYSLFEATGPYFALLFSTPYHFSPHLKRPANLVKRNRAFLQRFFENAAGLVLSIFCAARCARLCCRTRHFAGVLSLLVRRQIHPRDEVFRRRVLLFASSSRKSVLFSCRPTNAPGVRGLN